MDNDYEQYNESWGRLIWRLIYPCLLFFGVTIVVELIIMVPQMISFINENNVLSNDEMLSELMNLAYSEALDITAKANMILVPILYFFFWNDKRNIRKKNLIISYERLNIVKYVFVILAALTACLFFNNVVASLHLEESSAAYQQFELAYEGSSFWVKAFATTISAPLVEELLYRGLIYKRLRFKVNFISAAIISSVLFGVTHGNIVQGIYAFCVGMIIAYVYEKYKNLWAPILFHFIANLTSVLVETYINYEISPAVFLLITIAEGVALAGSLLLIKRYVNRQIKPVEEISNIA